MKKLICMFLILSVVLAVPVGAVDMDLPAKSAVLMDVATGTLLYEQNAHTPLAPASVTKVMTMLLIMEAIDSGKIGWDDTVTASETAVRISPNSSIVGSSWAAKQATADRAKASLFDRLGNSRVM